MNDIVIRAQHLSKQYRLGERNAFPTLRESLVSFGKGVVSRRTPPVEREKTFWALRDISFDVRAGEVLGIVGGNGVGKSTLLKILSRIVEPTGGRVELHGRLGALLEVGTGFHSELTGRENIFLNGAILGMGRAETAAKFDAIVDFAGVAPFIDTPVKHYSSGMYLRLAFAVAAHIEPDILAIDEVLAVGDIAFQRKCLGKVKSLAGSGRTVLFVSHQLAIVQKLCSRAILIGDGVVKADGSPDNVIDQYLRSIEERSAESLATRTNRSGRGRTRLTRVEVIGANGAIVSGRAAHFRFHTVGKRAQSDCSFTIYDNLGVAVTSFDTADHSEVDRGGSIFTCELDCLLLRPGRYRINAALTSRDGTVEDHVEGALVFNVQPGLIEGRPVNGQPGYGGVTVPHRWITEAEV